MNDGSINIKHTANNIRLTPPQNNIKMGIADTGASGHYLKPGDPVHISGQRNHTITVGLPNGAHLQSTNEDCALALPQLPLAAQRAHIIPGLSHHSLISIGTMCDSDCTAVFNKHEVNIQHNNQTILTGKRNPLSGLWNIPLETTTPQINNVYQTKSIPDLIQYLHSAAFSPIASTWFKAIKRGYFQSWPGLTIEAARKHYPKTMATSKGHMDQTRSNQRSTKTHIREDDLLLEPPQEHNNEATQVAFATVENIGKIYTDQTGLPHQVKHGKQLHHDSL